MELLEQIFKAGYEAGYQVGGDDAIAYEHGCENKRSETRQADKHQAWLDFDAGNREAMQ